jgi:histone-lysine N-methyltransferase SETMAR
MSVIPHPPYSPDLAHSELFLFPKMKLKLKGYRFDTIEEIQVVSQIVYNSLPEKDISECINKWRIRWGRCLYAGGK